MPDVEALLREYIQRFESGGDADPSDVLDTIEGADRARLQILIEGYLEHAAPAQEWDPAAADGSVAERAAGLVRETWDAESAELPTLLRSLRKRAKLRRSELMDRLAESLGFPSERERVAVYYNAMEHGQLAPAGISSKVFDALASLLDTSADALRTAGESVAPAAGSEPAEVFARAHVVSGAEGGQPPRKAPEPQPEPDELDRLFIGG